MTVDVCTPAPLREFPSFIKPLYKLARTNFPPAVATVDSSANLRAQLRTCCNGIPTASVNPPTLPPPPYSFKDVITVAAVEELCPGRDGPDRGAQHNDCDPPSAAAASAAALLSSQPGATFR